MVAAGRAPTRRAKGSAESLDGAVALVRRLERQHGVDIEVAAAAPLRPVETATAAVPEERPRTGRLWVAAVGAGTAGGEGVGTGRPHRLGSAPTGTGRLVAVVPAGMGYRAAVDLLLPLAEADRLAAVVLADDEAVLIANRLPVPVPVVDEVDVETAMRADLLAVECSRDGRPLQVLPDPLRLAELFGLADAELADAAALAPLLQDATNAVVALGGAPDEAAADGQRLAGARGVGAGPIHRGSRAVAGRPGRAGARLLPAARPGDVRRRRPVERRPRRRLAPGAGPARRRRDATRHSRRVAGRRAVRRPVGCSRRAVGCGRAGRRVRGRCCARGALSTPGATRDTVVVDLGGGTIDAVSATRRGRRRRRRRAAHPVGGCADRLHSGRRRTRQARPGAPGRSTTGAAGRGRHAPVPRPAGAAAT